MQDRVVVIPCFNERGRLEAASVSALTQGEDAVSVLLVDDGSTDGTGDFLGQIAEALGQRVRVLRLHPNGGKAEAVRVGLVHAIAGGARVVGFADADFATSPTELKKLAHVLDSEQLDVVMGSRIARLGAKIDRSTSRHISGRIFATVASLALELTVYDTQCGAKWFRVDERLRHVLQRPFASRWAFDVELLGRLLGRFETELSWPEPIRIAEIPLDEWRDVPGSKLDTRGMLAGFAEVCVLFASHRAVRLIQHGAKRIELVDPS